MKAPEKAAKAILAAGGIVVRDAPEPLIAIVQLRKDNSWVLPKGKLKRQEDALAAARREVLEETGHDVAVHEFLGSMSHATGGRLKIVQFWRMQAADSPVRKLMRDVKAVQWLPLERAVATLTHAREQAFLANVGPVALKAAGQSGNGAPVEPANTSARDEAGGQAAHGMFAQTIRAWFRRLTQQA